MERRGFFAALAAMMAAPVLRLTKSAPTTLPPEAFKSSGWTPIPMRPVLRVTAVNHQTGTITVERMA